MRLSPRLAFLCCFWLSAGLASAQPAISVGKDPSRRDRETPGLMIETHARQGDCDVLRFTPDGKRLLVTGDDKFLRVFRYDNGQLKFEKNILWPVFRERRGMIFALDIHPVRKNIVAIAGSGVRTQLIGVYDLDSGKQIQTMEGNIAENIWCLRFDPSGKYLVAGHEKGAVLQFDFDRPESTPVTLIASTTNAEASNRVRLIEFEEPNACTVLHRDGRFTRVELSKPSTAKNVATTTIPNPFFAEYNRGSQSMAIVGEEMRAAEFGKARSVEWRMTTRAQALIPIRATATPAAPRTVAFSRDGKRLAIGTFEFIHHPDQITQGKVQFYQLVDNTPKLMGNPVTFNWLIDRIAFDPMDASKCIVASGEDHDLHVVDVDTGKILQTVRSEYGHSIWGIKLAKDLSKIYFSSKRDPKSTNPNDRSADAWRSFQLSSGKITPVQQISDAIPSRDTMNGWSLQAPTKDVAVWSIVGPTGVTTLTGNMFDRAIFYQPFCWTFFQNESTRTDYVVIGHKWGASLYSLDKKAGPKLVRIMNGHESDVTSLAVSPSGDLLLTASRDMTICGWSLTDWGESRSELGANFQMKDGRVYVSKVVAGSPAWEVGLTNPQAERRDEIRIASISADKIFVAPGSEERLERLIASRLYSPVVKKIKRISAAELIQELADPVPGKQIAISWKDGASQEEYFDQTTVRQRPLWRLFPTRTNEYLVWLWRDYWYDVNFDAGENVAGWLTWDRKLKETPSWYALSAFKNRLDPARVRKALTQSLREPELETFLSIEPPKATITITQQPNAKQKVPMLVKIEAFARTTAQNAQRIQRMEVWVNEHRVKSIAFQADPFRHEQIVEIPVDQFRSGSNNIQLRVQNRGDAWGMADAPLENFDSGETRKRLFSMIVYVGSCNIANQTRSVKYQKRGELPDVLQLQTDANQFKKKIDRERLNGTLYTEVMPTIELYEEKATAQQILQELKDVRNRVGPEDVFILYVLGHGETESNLPESWYFVAYDGEPVRGKDIRTILQDNFRSRVAVFIQACHSGGNLYHQTAARSLEGRITFMACKYNEKAIVTTDEGLYGNILVQVLEEPNQNGIIDTATLDNEVRKQTMAAYRRMRDNHLDPRFREAKNPELVKLFLEQENQTPIARREQLEDFPIFSTIKGTKSPKPNRPLGDAAAALGVIQNKKK